MNESMPACQGDHNYRSISVCSVNDRQVAIAAENAMSCGKAISNRDKETKQRYLEEEVRATFSEIGVRALR